LTRHELKEQLQHDQFTDAVSRTLDYVTENRERVTRWVIVAVVLLAIAGGWFWYSRHERSVRQQDIQAAFAVLDAQVGPANNQFAGKTFPTQEAKTQAAMKALARVVAKDSGSREGFIAQYYLGTLKASQNDNGGAEADLKAAASSKTEIAPLAKIALARLYANENKTPEAQELLRSIVNHPTDLVSKAQAQILLAQLDEKANPQQAKNILKSLQTPNQSPTVSRAVNDLLNQASK
jgi:predicted negative regulator of RcsB-dependent stress response